MREIDQAGGLRDMMLRAAGHQNLRVIAIASGKGGVGKTNLAANLAVLAARSGQRVLVIDADLGLANVEILYGLTPRHHLGHVIDGSMPLESVMAEGPHGVRVLPAGSGVQSLSHLDDGQKLRLVSALDTLEDKFDLVFVDAGAGIGDNVIFFVGAAHEAILVVSPEPTSITDAYAALKVLSVDAGVRNFNVLVMQARTDAAARVIFQKLGSVASRFLDVRLQYLGSVPRDENVHRAVMAQRPLVDLFPFSPASRALSGVNNTLLNTAPPPTLDGGLKFLWSRVLRESRAASVG